MQELRLVAVSEDGSYAILAVPGRSGRFLVPIDDRLRTVAKGQFSRLAQYEIEVENPLRPKEIQDRIRAGETADEIAETAGIPPEKIRRFEGPILAERQYQAEQAQRATIRGHGDSGPGPRLGDVVAERLNSLGASQENSEWDSRKRPDGNWQVQLQFVIGGRTGTAEWVYDARRRHVIPDGDHAVQLCLPEAEWAALQAADRGRATATVTPIGSRLADPHREQPQAARGSSAGSAPPAARAASGSAERRAALTARSREPARPDEDVTGSSSPPVSGTVQAGEADDAVTEASEATGQPAQDTPAGPRRKAAGGRSRRSSVPSWDEIMFGTSRPD
jgi:Protein of unknown function (DUF3071)